MLATIPAETIPRLYIAQTLGLVMGIGEVVGGFAALTITGWLTDVFGMDIPFLIAGGVAVGGGLIALLLVETAPELTIKKTVIGEITQ